MLFALSGMIAGPWLSSIHIAPLRGWSPVAVLYGLTVPPVLLMLGWIAIVVGGYTYLVNVRVQLTRDSPPDEGEIRKVECLGKDANAGAEARVRGLGRLVDAGLRVAAPSA